MAHIEQRPSGWRAQIRRKGAPSVSRTFDLKADAEAWAREIERQLQRGNAAVLRQDAQRMTIAEAIERYESERLPALRSHDTVKGHLSRIREHFGSCFIANVRSPDIAGWRSDLLALGLSNTTAGHHMTSLSSLFSFIAKDLGIDLPAGNPCRLARKPTRPKGRDRRLRADELDALLAAAEQARAVGLRQIIILALETSMRLGEMIGLEWSRIDLTRRTAHLVDTKNGESRTVALSSAAMEALRTLQAGLRRIDGRVFCWAASDSFQKVWTRCKTRARAAYEADCKAQGIRPDPAFLADLRFHDLRHEATSRLFEKGLGVMEVASMTGHKSLSMLKRYTHIEAEKLAKKLG